MKSLLSTTLVASLCAFGGASIAQTTPSTAPGNSSNQTKAQAARTDGAPPTATNPNAPAGSGMGSSTTNSGAARNDPARTSTKTDEQAARKGEPAPAGAYAGEGQQGGRMATRRDALRGMDSNGDGAVSKSEFMAYHEAMYERMPKDSNGNVSVAAAGRSDASRNN